MEALMAAYASDSGDDDSPRPPPRTSSATVAGGGASSLPPPPPLDLLDPPPHLLGSQSAQVNRVRSFPHVEGNYALHVFMPVSIPSTSRKMLASFVKRISSLVPGLRVVDADIPLGDLCNEDQIHEQFVLGRELHISLGRTVPIKVHQIDSIVSMLRQKLLSQKRYLIDFNKWEVFVNDDLTRSFLSIEVTEGGLSQIIKQIQIVNNVYRLHGLPEFYENPRPHVSLLWALGDISHTLKQAVERLNKVYYGLGTKDKLLFRCQFGGIECKIGKKLYKVCQITDQ